ncbi:MAG: D-tyrosyl-tRNA(Tyr) deacylase [Bradymonadia bacterium]|jgi:D-tyrosyl-tRNA(Tyr) deacylase
MRAVVQRVREASVTIEGEVVGEIGLGLLVLLGAGTGDEDSDLEYVRNKVLTLRVFEDDAGKMNRSVQDIGGELLVVSQFTLYGDCRKGRRPSFISAMHPDQASPMVDTFVARCREAGVSTETGRFGADMDVRLLNDGPVTLLIDSSKTF